MAKSERKLSALDRAVEQAIGDGREVGNPEDPAKERWPELWQWLTRIYVGKDKLVTPASLSIRMVTGGVAVSCSHRDLAVAVSCTTPLLADVLDAIEKALADPSTPLASWGRKEPTTRTRKLK